MDIESWQGSVNYSFEVEVEYVQYSLFSIHRLDWFALSNNFFLKDLTLLRDNET